MNKETHREGIRRRSVVTLVAIVGVLTLLVGCKPDHTVHVVKDPVSGTPVIEEITVKAGDEVRIVNDVGQDIHLAYDYGTFEQSSEFDIAAGGKKDVKVAAQTGYPKTVGVIIAAGPDHGGAQMIIDPPP